jgi:transmembrane sensor
MEDQEKYVDLVLKELSNTITPDEKHELNKWLVNAANQKLFDDIKLSWTPAKATGERLGNTLTNWWRIEQRLWAEEPIQPSLPQEQEVKKLSFRWMQWAAVAVAAMSALLWSRYGKSDQEVKIVAVWKTVKTLSGQIEKVILPDSSAVWLNGSSTLKYADNFIANRAVILLGEAYFDVRKSNNQFKVTSGDINVVVKGTRFLVSNTSSNHTKISVEEGTVGITADNKEIGDLIANQQLSYRGKDSILIKKVDAKLLAGWKDKILYFDASPLREVVESLERYYGIKIQINKAVGACTVSGTFRDQPVEDVINTIAYSLDLKTNIAPNRIILNGIGCSGQPPD